MFRIIVMLFIFGNLIYIPQILKGQNFIISSPKNNYLYLGIGNTLEYYADSMQLTNYFLTTDNGKISEIDSCSFFIVPEKQGIANIDLKKVHKNGDTVYVGRRIFRVKSNPEIIAKIAGKSAGVIRKNELFAQSGIAAVPLDIECYEGLKVSEYSMLVIRNDSCHSLVHENGALFTNKVSAILKNLQSNDKVLFFDIKAKRQQQQFELRPIEFTINN